ncbi:MAG: phosphotransferase [Actinomycetota bacterium]
MTGGPADGDAPCRGLDPAWLAQQLAEGFDSARPAVAFDRFIGTGQMSRNARFTVVWDEPTAGPESIVVKVPSGNPSTRAVSADSGIYQRECAFYSTVRELVDIRVPKPLAVSCDDDGLDFAILLEDLRRSTQGDHLEGLDDGQIDLAIGQAAALHAPLWDVDHPALSAIGSDAEDRGRRVQALVEMILPVCLERLRTGLDDDVPRFLDAFVPRIADWVATPRTTASVVHGDFRADNFLFGDHPEAPPLAVVDWQTVTTGAGVTDISYLLGGTLEVDRRRVEETARLDQYRAELAARGADYPAHACFDDYALGTPHGITTALVATVMADETERGDALFALMLNRHTHHAIDVDLLDRIAPPPLSNS